MIHSTQTFLCLRLALTSELLKQLKNEANINAKQFMNRCCFVVTHAHGLLTIPIVNHWNLAQT